MVTAALPYANGPIHIGHLVEYVQADIFVRFLRLLGNNVLFICADDTHGTPIEVNARKLGIKPEELIERYHKEHKRDFDDFLVSFDNFYTTNSPENKHYSDLFFSRMKEKGYVYKKAIELTYCEKCKRFLPDRFVKGKCPKCGAEDQYGDVCESCNASYKTTDLVEPYCVICKSKPVKRSSEHYFFKLSAFSKKLEKWIAERNFQKEIKKFVLNWIKNGLEDWNISRDGPYFGFKIPGEESKYYYVWLDAPIGYIASTENWCRKHGRKAENYWQSEECRIIHFIGKDIIYFHFLFWPAMLEAADFNLPEDIIVHGHLTLNKEKLSKSRGTLITARQYLDLLNPELLRFYFASNLSHTMSDIGFELKDFTDKVNNELVSNLANFVYRVFSFTNANFDSEISVIAERALAKKAEDKFVAVEEAYKSYNCREAVKLILELSALGNKYFQDNKPWDLIKRDKEKTREVVTFCVNLAKNLSILISPVLPEFSKNIQKQLNLKELDFDDLDFNLKNHKIGKAEIYFRKIEHSELKGFGKKAEEEPFSKLNIKVAKIESAEEHPDADKLYILKIDLGTEKRQLVAGLRKHYKKEELVGKRILVLANLKPAKLRGIESQGMLLAADDGKDVVVLEAKKSEPGESAYIEGIAPSDKEISYEEFSNAKMVVKDKKVVYNGEPLKTANEEIIVEARDGNVIR